MSSLDAVAQSSRAAGMRPSEAGSYADRTVKQVTSGISKGPSSANGGAGDDFIIGDRVIVSNTKHGYIQYLGTTQFAAGEWAGVVLDEPLGKNDGSVKGIRYFQCEPKRGVFARPDKLVREQPSSSSTPKGAGANAAQISRPSGLPSAPRMGTRVGSPRGTNSKPPSSASSKESLQKKTSSSAEDGQEHTGLKVRKLCFRFVDVLWGRYTSWSQY